MRFKSRLFVTLLSAGLLGVVSFLLVDLGGLIASMPLPAGTEIPRITPALKLLSLIQPSVLVALAVYLGVTLAPKVGLSSPVAEAAVSGAGIASALRPQLVPGLIGGLLGGVGIVLSSWSTKYFLTPEMFKRISGLGQFIPLPTRLLYGGITEELLLRWGVMTLLVWAIWRLFQKGKTPPHRSCFVAAILISSILFGVGHLPIAFMLFPEATSALTVYVIVANSMFGLIAGYLFWQKGLESAMIAHMLAHVVMFTANYFGAYF